MKKVKNEKKSSKMKKNVQKYNQKFKNEKKFKDEQRRTNPVRIALYETSIANINAGGSGSLLFVQ